MPANLECTKQVESHTEQVSTAHKGDRKFLGARGHESCIIGKMAPARELFLERYIAEVRGQAESRKQNHEIKLSGFVTITK